MLTTGLLKNELILAVITDAPSNALFLALGDDNMEVEIKAGEKLAICSAALKRKEHLATKRTVRPDEVK